MLDRKAAQDILAFYIEAGVDALVGEDPIDRFAPEPARAAESPLATERPALERPASTIRTSLPPKNAPPVAGPAVAAPLAPDVAVMAAREAARGAKTLDELRAIMAAFEGCALRKTAKQL